MPDLAIPEGFQLEGAPQAAPQALPSGGVAIPEGFVLEGQQQAPKRGVINALTGADGGERYQTWPERLVRTIGDSIVSGVTLPGDVLHGDAKIPSSGAVPGSVPFGDKDSAGVRVADLAMFGTPTNPAVRAGGTAIPMGRSVEAAPSNGRLSITVNPLRENFEPVFPVLSEGQRAAAAGQRIGVDIPKAAASDSATVQRAGKVVSAVPLLGDKVIRASERATSQLGEAASRAETMSTGLPTAPQQAGEAAKDSIINWIGPRSREIADRTYSKVDELVNPDVLAPLTKTAEVAQKIIDRRENAAISAPSDAVNRIKDAIGRNGLNYSGIKDLRSYIGELMNSSVLPADLSKSELKQIYGALSEDYRNITAAAGGQQAKDALVRADKIFQSISQRRESLAKIIGESGDAPGEAIFAKIKALASTSSRADAVALQQARKAAGPEAWNEISSAVIGTLGKNRKGDWDPNIFLNDFAKFSEAGKQSLFKSTANEKVLPFLKDIEAVSKRFNQWNRFENTSRTGSIITGSALGAQALSTAKAAIGGAVLEPLTFISGVVGTTVLARALASPATAAPTARFARAYVAAAINPSAQTISGFNMAARNLANSLGMSPADFMRRMQSPVSVPANESETPGEQKN